MRKVLLKDLVVPAGTIFYDTPIRREYSKDAYIETTIGLTKNTAGHFTYEVSGELDEWFREYNPSLDDIYEETNRQEQTYPFCGEYLENPID